MRYVYEHAKHGTREVYEPMKNAPPHAVVFEPDGRWRPWTDEDGEDAAWVRVYYVPAVIVGKGGAVNHRGQDVPVSHSMPKAFGGEPCTYQGREARRLSCGAYTTPDGFRIVDNKANRDRHLKDCGYVDA